MLLNKTLFVVGLGLLAYYQTTQAATLYSIDTLGFYDVEHTRNDGYKSNSASQINEAGQVAGNAQRYNGGSTFFGISAWLYNGSGTINVGLTGTEHTRNDDYKYNVVSKLNEAGQVAGKAERYNGGGVFLGNSAWLYNGSNTINIGLTGVEHTRDNGYKNSIVSQLNQAGQVVGSAQRYNGGSADLGNSVWLYNGSNTVNVGLTNAEHTRYDGYKSSDKFQLNEAGQVAGRALRFDVNGGSANLGYSAWLYNGSSTVNIGLTGLEHAHNGGYKK